MQCPSLAHLDLGFNGIGDEGAGRLAAVLPRCTSLAQLELSRNSIGDNGILKIKNILDNESDVTLRNVLIRAIVRKPKRVQVKQLSRLNLEGNRIGERGTIALAKMLANKNFPGLTLLNMRHNPIGEKARNSLEYSAKAMPSLSVLFF